MNPALHRRALTSRRFQDGTKPQIVQKSVPGAPIDHDSFAAQLPHRSLEFAGSAPAALVSSATTRPLAIVLCTIREATALADWVALHDRNLTTIYITHGHGDHWLGLSVLLERFPEARAVATAGTVRLMRTGAGPEVQSNSYRARFPGQIAETITLAEPLNTDHIELEDRPLQVIETGHTDAVDTTALYAPDLGLIVSGDTVYNHCHMYVGATTAIIRAEWIAAIGKLAALHPTAVVTGHKDPTQGNPPTVLAESRGYLEYYGQLREAGLPDHELFEAMVSRYPDWVSRQQFLILGL